MANDQQEPCHYCGKPGADACVGLRNGERRCVHNRCLLAALRTKAPKGKDTHNEPAE